MRRSLSLLFLLTACSAGGSVDSGTPADYGPFDGGSSDTSVDARPLVDAPSCLVDGPLPTSAPSHCHAVVTDDAAFAPVGHDADGGYVGPDGRRVSLNAGTRIELTSGFPMRSALVAGTPFAVVTDGGIEDEHLIVLDLDLGTVVADVPFVGDTQALFLGITVSTTGATRRVWLSGGGTNRIYAYDLDASTGALTPASASDVVIDRPLAERGYVAGIALLPDGHTLVASLMLGAQIVFLDTTTRTELATLDVGGIYYPYDLILSPDGAKAYVSLWGAHAVQVVDTGTRTLGPRIAVGKNPEGFALSPDGATLAVGDADSDDVTLIDITSDTVVTTVPMHAPGEPNNVSPTQLAFADANSFYVVAANENAVDLYRRASVGAAFVLAGRVPTAWYPTDVQVRPDGSLVVCNGKDDGTGPNLTPAATSITELLRGSVTLFPPPDATSLAAMTAEVDANNGRMSHFVDVACDPGVTDDFPVPRPGDGPSTKIHHVIIVMRENKTYDCYLGDLRGHDGMAHGNGDPTLTLFPLADMEGVLPNTRELARTFALSDNYYSDAEQSSQGHFWTAFGRNTDFNERSWLTSGGRSYWAVPGEGVIDDIGYTEEGSFIEYLDRESISYSVWGELNGTTRTGGPTVGYPGLVFTLDVADSDKARFLANRWQNRCILPSYSFALFPRDHTYGLGGGHPTPQSMIAENDEAVGIVAEAISHSTWWPDTLLIVIEDDPQDGGDHVDNHRSPLIAISPWIKREYVSHVHVNESSMMRTVQLILGLTDSYNGELDDVAPLYDMFSATPDYTPYVALPRTWPEQTNPAGTPADLEARAAHWDFSAPDQQPGLSRHLFRWLRGRELPSTEERP